MPTYVTKPFLPPLEEFIPYLEEIWKTRVLSNAGPYHTQLEAQLCQTLGIKHISLFGNGTLALLVAFRALGLENAEVITTPYSFVATSSALVWSKNTPVFVDVEPNSTNIDPAKIRAAITPKTKAILAVHCYGHPCRSEEIESIAKAHGLFVIYDAAHAFGVETEDGSVLNHGDLSVLSFHATKSFNTFEGGAIVCNSAEMKTKIDRLKNFGFSDELNINVVGINAKMNEFNAALGLLQLKHFDQTLEMRSRVDQMYRSRLANVPGVQCLDDKRATRKNYGYFPVLVTDKYPLSRDALYDYLKEQDIYTRRYFYPLISNFVAYRDLPTSDPTRLPVATQLANQILCLPIYPDLPLESVAHICDLIQSLGNRSR